jgi:hypothetical protein
LLTFESLKEEMISRHNQLVIACDLTVCRFIGVCDGEEDYYYVIQNPFGARYPRTYMSAVGRLLFLKDNMSVEDYEYLDQFASLNGCVPSEEFVIADI